MIVTSSEVVSYAKSIHYREQDFYDGNIKEMIETHDEYQLMIVPLSKLSEVDTELDEDLLEEYSHMNTEIPPIILSHYDNGTYLTIDGGHRITTARNKGMRYIMAYIGVGEPNYENIESEED